MRPTSRWLSLSQRNTRTMAGNSTIGGERGWRQGRPPGTHGSLPQATRAALVAALLALVLIGAALSQAAAPSQAGDYRPCPPRTHWECNE